ncbi:HAMP domain protein [Synechococcus sp. PCC 7335]|uniref:cache domain-containing protein n=1 Tax=Synechococcus sp. (strain ATCC 29403 / PCC 7335) TaxID=91464 RepID=UPI00017EE41F|nr:cache domain-containing protein [Synechococcus sp. PCC 7335]EDX84345.1 HAMP domain protein [Synechococcus sp. PCC 7335]
MQQTARSTPEASTLKTSAKLKQQLRRNSFGIRLFSMIMGGAVLSIASVAFLFAETVKFQAEEQIQKVLEGKVGTVHEITDRAENLAYSLGVSVSTLHVRRAETPETYQELVRQLFESQPSYVLGMGFGQKEGGILPSKEWFYPYYQIDSGVNEVSSSGEEGEAPPTSVEQTTAQASTLRYTDRAEQPYFYPNTEAYRNYFLPQKSLWTAPYQSDRGMLLTYYSQIFDNQGEWLGTAVVDIDEAYLQTVLNEPVFRQGGKLFLLSEDGRVVANPSAPEQVIDQTYADVSGLTEVWPQIRRESSSGLIEGRGGYWSYLQIPEQSWVVLAYVPYHVVFGRIAAIALGAMLLAGLLMSGITVLAVRYLNRRLRPVIDECQRLYTAGETVTEKLAGKDELTQLSISFFNLIEQLKLSRTRVELEAARTAEVEAQLSQIKRAAADSQRQRPLGRKSIDILPLVDDMQAALASSSNSPATSLQQELAWLYEIVSMLASDGWLINVIEDHRGDLLPAAERSELSQISDRLEHTFLQILSALDRFSRLLSAFGETYDHVIAVEQEMRVAKRDVSSQAEVVGQLQQWAKAHETLLHELTPAESGQSLAVANSQLSTSSKNIDLVIPAITAFHQTTQQLSQDLRSLFTATENISRKSKQYQRLNTTAQVLIANASTLSISASRQKNSEIFEDILSQFRSQSIDLETLSNQLEETYSQQQQNVAQVEKLSADLQSGMDAVEQVATTLDSFADSLTASQLRQNSPSNVEAMRHSHSSSPSDKQAQHLDRQLRMLHRRLEKLASLITTTYQHVDTALVETSQISQIRTEVPLALLPQREARSESIDK